MKGNNENEMKRGWRPSLLLTETDTDTRPPQAADVWRQSVSPQQHREEDLSTRVILIANIVTTSEAPVPNSVAPVTTSMALVSNSKHCYY